LSFSKARVSVRGPALVVMSLSTHDFSEPARASSMAFMSSSLRLTLTASTASSTWEALLSSGITHLPSLLCLGCGRCDVACPVEIPISGILGDLKRRFASSL